MSDIIQVQGQHYIKANASIADNGGRVLKQGDTFVVFDRHGDVRPLGFENQGLFHEGTRFLSRWKLSMNGTAPLLLSSNVKEDNDFLAVDLTNPSLRLDDGRSLNHGVLHIVRTVFLLNGEYFERVEIASFAAQPVLLALQFDFESDFVDLFEVRGTPRKSRGRLLAPEVGSNCVTLGYEGLDATTRRTIFHFSIHPQEISPSRALFRFDLSKQTPQRFETRITCKIGAKSRAEETFQGAFDKVHSAFRDYRKDVTTVESSNPQFNDWIRQSRADLHLLLTKTDCGSYPYAGIPWFSTIFGRDGIITALETLWTDPAIARAVLCYLAERQATTSDAETDAEPGKILHEERKGEMAATGEVPFGCYYGSIDSTPLWLMLAGCYYDRTGDEALVRRLWPHITRALDWVDHYGDCDGDGFVEYRQRSARGLNNQGWKDSQDAIFHADGTYASPPIALCEVQGYVFAAKQKIAALAERMGDTKLAAALREQAEKLRSRFHAAFWCEEIKTYALALDGNKNPCRVRSSNAGHCLFTGIAEAKPAAHVAGGLLSDAFFSGWGIRTIASSEVLYNPMSYHNGSIWPHDNALIGAGLEAYGYKREVLRVFGALFDASRAMDLNRLPELYCGFSRRPGEGPTLYPVACNPQAWSSAAVFRLLQACLGLRFAVGENRIYFNNPALPDCVERLDIRHLKMGSGVVDVSLIKHAQDVSVNVRHQTGDVEVVVTHGAATAREKLTR